MQAPSPIQSQARRPQPPVRAILPTWNVPPALLEVIDEVLFNVLRPAFCDVCRMGGVHTFGLTYHDASTNTRYCLECLEAACEPLPEGPEDAGIVAYAEEWIGAHAERRQAAQVSIT